MQIFFTVISGTLVYVLGQLFFQLILDPIKAFRNTIESIDEHLILYSNIYSQPKMYTQITDKEIRQKYIDCFSKFRVLASQLTSKQHQIPLYKFLKNLFGLPETKSIQKAHENLIGLSNGFNNSEFQGLRNQHREELIREKLGLPLQGEKMNPQTVKMIYEK